jgi:hypothetical protein
MNCWVTSIARILASGLLFFAACSSADEQSSDPPGDGNAGPGRMDGGSLGCTPGETKCQDGFEALCDGNGLWLNTGVMGDCGGAQDSCADARNRRSYVGCDYWPVDLDNAIEVWQIVPEDGQCNIPGNSNWQYRDSVFVCRAGDRLSGLCAMDRSCPDGTACVQGPACVLDAQNSNFSIVVSNPSNRAVATVTLQAPDGSFISEDVPPGGVNKLQPYLNNVADASIDGSGQTMSAFRLLSTSPIVAYQFNPLDNEGVFSNDGSLLLPTHALGGIYFVMTLPTVDRRPYGHPYSGYATIVAVDQGVTDIEVMPSAAVRAGVRQTSFPARVAQRFSLRQGEVLNLEADGRGDLTGTRIATINPDARLAVYVGHESTLITDRDSAGPNDPLCCGDHIEEQLFPVSTWGDRFGVVRTAERIDSGRGGGVAPDRLRILAASGDTRVEFNPAPVTGNCQVLVAGDYCDVYIQVDTKITANKPILVGQMLLSTDGSEGDPALAFLPPIAQYRTSYTFLVPSEYAAQHIAVSATATGSVLLDGEDIAARLTSFGTDLRGGRFPMNQGRHTLECPEHCGLVVVGYDEAVSYMFAGGLDLEPIRLE